MPKGMVIGVAINQRTDDGIDITGIDVVAERFDPDRPGEPVKTPGPCIPTSGSIHLEAQELHLQRSASTARSRSSAAPSCGTSRTPASGVRGANGAPADRATLLARMHDSTSTPSSNAARGVPPVGRRRRGDRRGRRAAQGAVARRDRRRLRRQASNSRTRPSRTRGCYDDYNLEKPAKRAGLIRLVEDLRARRVRVDGIGNQAAGGSRRQRSARSRTPSVDLHTTGLKVIYPELDVDLLPNAGRGAKPAVATLCHRTTREKRQQLAKRYADIFGVIVEHRDRSRA